MDWPSSGIRRASVNSFGYGGANSHTILDDAYNFMKIRDLSGRHRTLPKPQMSDSNPEFANTYHMRPKLLVLSAKDENGPIRLAKALESHLERVKLDNPKYVEDLVYTLGSKRCQLPWKSYMVLNQPWNSLQSSWSKFTKPTRSLTTPSEVAFLFTGQGSAWYGMGRELLEEPTLRQSISVSQEHLQSLGCTWSLKEELSCDKSLSRVSYARYSQPICTALQIALSNMMDAWNILPTAVVGHSSGEIAAAYCAQALSHRDTHQRKCAIVLQVV